MSRPLIALVATLKSLLSAAKPKHICLELTTAGRDLLPLSVELRPHTCLSVRTHRSQLPEPPYGGGTHSQELLEVTLAILQEVPLNMGL